MTTNIETARLSAEHFSSGNVEAFLGYVAPNCAWTTQAGSLLGGTYTGPKELLEKFLMPLSEMFDFRMEVKKLVEAGEDIISTGTYHATHRPSGNALSCEFVHVARWEEGKLTSLRDFTDTHLFALATQV